MSNYACELCGEREAKIGINKYDLYDETGIMIEKEGLRLCVECHDEISKPAWKNKSLIKMALAAILILLTVAYFVWPRSSTVTTEDLIQDYISGEVVRGDTVEFIVVEIGYSPLVGTYIWTDRDDVSYVTNFKYVGDFEVGDRVMVEVGNMYTVMDSYIVEISNLIVNEGW